MELTEEQLEVLNKIADHEGCEWGDQVGWLLELWEHIGYFSDGLKKAMYDELMANYKVFQENYKFEKVERNKTVTYDDWEIVEK